ncbi:JAB domain-containing protein [Bacillus mycoides]
MNSKTASSIVAHNHLNDEPTSSREDIELMKYL